MWKRLTIEEVIEIHDEVINSSELKGLARGKSLDGALSRIENRIVYGLIADEFDLSAMYAVVLARGHLFNDANKRTAYMCMHTVLQINGVPMMFENVEIGDLIIKVAQGLMDEVQLADWLRKKRIKDLEAQIRK